LYLALLATPAPRLFAQAWSYPALQPPRTAVREFNFAVAQADGPGTSLVFQWREESGVRQQLSLDVGVADSDVENTDLMVFIGGQFAYQLSRSSDEVPMDFLLTAGAFLAVGEFTLFRFPVGLSVGHRFELEDGMALTPWLHPRVSIDLCNNCPEDSESDLALTFDLGLNFEVSRTISIRAAGIFTGNESFDNDGFGISVAWTPPGLTRSARRFLR
jgi:hypothetical protein